jgi:hypothetical protein
MAAVLNPLKSELNPISHLLAFLGPHHILHVSRIRVKMSNNLHRLRSGIAISYPAQGILCVVIYLVSFTPSAVGVSSQIRTGQSEFDSNGGKYFFSSPLGPTRPSVHKSVGRIPSGVELKTHLHLAPK